LPSDKPDLLNWSSGKDNTLELAYGLCHFSYDRKPNPKATVDLKLKPKPKTKIPNLMRAPKPCKSKRNCLLSQKPSLGEPPTEGHINGAAH